MLAGCAGKELVMAPGMVIKATNSNGTVTIQAEDELKRTYLWENKRHSVKLIPRRKRWYGSLGGYSPGGGLGVHAVVEEGQQHFCSEDEAIEWLHWENERMQWVYTGDGLVVGFSVSDHPLGKRMALAVDVWQFYINGEKPKHLLGAQPDRIRILQNSAVGPSVVTIGKFVPSQPTVINGRKYSGRAIDVMKEKSITPEEIERALTEKAGDARRYGRYSVYTGKCGSAPCFIKVDEAGRVVLVIR